VTSLLYMFEATIWVKSTHGIKWCFKPEKGRKCGNKIYFT